MVCALRTIHSASVIDAPRDVPGRSVHKPRAMWWTYALLFASLTAIFAYTSGAIIPPR